MISQSEIVPPTSIVCSKLLLDGCNNGDGRSSGNDNGTNENNDDENNDDSDDDGGNGSIRFLPNMFLFLIAILPMILWLVGHNFIFVWWNSYI